MRVMARRADVLHGEFIQPNRPRQSAATPLWLADLLRQLNDFRLTARR
jgi:hypothetical protein